MDEKTAELRDIFVDATGAETVTESQESGRGSLTDRDDATVTRRVQELIATMRERYAFSSDLPDSAYERVVRAHFEGDGDGNDGSGESDDAGSDDAAIAADLASAAEDPNAELDAAPEISSEDVFRARMDLHLVRDDDREFPVEFEAVTRLVLAGATTAELAEELGIDAETAARCRRVAEADVESTRANHRFRDEFRELLTDVELEETHATDAREDGLREAAEDIETDVSF
ncbi:hypothetical protein ACFQAS_09850 [Halopenitus salinus]|uniref:Conditioned medium-induced protein 4 n=1 Tax=Halopenitus salinus TaxID=1198295 RepID=A0ABD5URV8_9EURY